MPATSIDSSTVRLPRQIVERSERIRQMTEAANAPPAETAAPAADASPAPPTEPPSAPTPTPTSPRPDQEDAAAAALPTGDPRHTSLDYWKQRTSAVMGMLRSERRTADETIAGLRGQIRALQEQLQAKESTAPTTPQTIDLASMFTQEQRQQYGDEQLQVIAGPILAKAVQAAQEAAAAATKPLQEEREEQRQTEAQRKWNAFADQLVALVPDALDVDKTPEWLQWLELTDEATGFTHRQVLKRHEGRFDAPKVAQLFEKYKRETGMAPSATPPAPSAPPAPQVPRPPVAPSARGGSGGGDLPPPAPTLTPMSKAEIREGFKRASLGKMSKEERAIFDQRLALSQ